METTIVRQGRTDIVWTVESYTVDAQTYTWLQGHTDPELHGGTELLFDPDTLFENLMTVKEEASDQADVTKAQEILDATDLENVRATYLRVVVV